MAKSWLMICLLCFLPQTLADIYKYKDKTTGMLYLTDHPIKSRKYKLLAKLVTKKKKKTPNYQSRYKILIGKIAKRYQLDPALLHAVIHAESSYNPAARSPKGAVGLMQLMPATAKRYGVKNRWNATENLHGGAKYLKFLMKKFQQNLKLVLAAYNAGENAVIRYGNKIPPYKETRRYVKKVLVFYKKYQKVFK